MLSKKTASVVASIVLCASLTLGGDVSAQAATSTKLTLSATGPSGMDITWAANGQVVSGKHGSAWKRTVTRRHGTYYSVAVDAYSTTGSVSASCTIKQGKKTIKHHSAKGQFVSVRCDYTTKY